MVSVEASDMDSDEEVTEMQLGVFCLAPKLVGLIVGAASAAAAGNVALQEQESRMEHRS